jgi:hypothetical protein
MFAAGSRRTTVKPTMTDLDKGRRVCSQLSSLGVILEANLDYLFGRELNFLLSSASFVILSTVMV